MGKNKHVICHIDLQDGFRNDNVVIRVGGKEVFRQADLNTRLQIGYAGSLQLPVEPGMVNVEVDLPLRKLSSSITLHVTTHVYLGVSVTPQGEIRYRVSEGPFGYL